MGKKQEAANKETAAEEIEKDQAEEQVGADNPPDEIVEIVENAPTTEELNLMLEEARNKVDENWDLLVRSRAEVENLRRRQERELESAHKFALERFLTDLLPVRDSLELGLSAAREEGANAAKLGEGTELTLKLLSDLMGRFNIEQIDPEGEPFNPEYHQAMSMQPREDLPANTVVTVVQRGYALNGRLVRPAMVIVSQAVS